MKTKDCNVVYLYLAFLSTLAHIGRFVSVFYSYKYFNSIRYQVKYTIRVTSWTVGGKHVGSRAYRWTCVRAVRRNESYGGRKYFSRFSRVRRLVGNDSWRRDSSSWAELQNRAARDEWLGGRNDGVSRRHKTYYVQNGGLTCECVAYTNFGENTVERDANGRTVVTTAHKNSASNSARS